MLLQTRLLLHALLHFSFIAPILAEAQEKMSKGHEQTQTCAGDESLIEILSQEYGSVLWINGKRQGFIPIKAFCLSSGLHNFALHTVATLQTVDQYKEIADQRRIKSQVVWIPSSESLIVDLDMLGQRMMIGLNENSGKRTSNISNKSHQASNRALYNVKKQQENKRQLDYLFLSSEFIFIEGLSQVTKTVGSLFYPRQHLLNRQRLKYKNSPKDKWTVQADIQGLKELVSHEGKLHSQDPWEDRFELWVQVLNIGFDWQLGSMVTSAKSKESSPFVKVGKARFGRIQVKHGARTNLIDGLELSQDLFSITRGKQLETFQLEVTLAQHRSHRLNYEPSLMKDGIQQGQNVWSELGLSYLQTSLQPNGRRLQVELSWLQLHSQPLIMDSKSNSSLLNIPDSLAVLQLDYYAQDQFVLSHLAINLLGGLSHSFHQIFLNNEAVNLAFTALWNYQAGDLWDQQWSAPSLWPNTYRDSQLTLNQALIWENIQLAYAYQEGAVPSWYKLTNRTTVTGQALSLSWSTLARGTLGSALINLPQQNFLTHRVMHSNTYSRVRSKQTSDHPKPKQQKPLKDLKSEKAYFEFTSDLGLEWLVVQTEHTQAWIPTMSDDNMSFETTPSKIEANNRTNIRTYILSGAWRLLRTYMHYQLKWEARLNYNYLDQELWPELSLAWQYEQLQLSAQCGKPLSVPLLLTLNRWFSYCGIQLEIDARVQR